MIPIIRSLIGMLSGSCPEKLIVFCIFTQYDIRPVLKLYSQSMPNAQEPLNPFTSVDCLQPASLLMDVNHLQKCLQKFYQKCLQNMLAENERFYNGHLEIESMR